jgi:hypothetical protein
VVQTSGILQYGLDVGLIVDCAGFLPDVNTYGTSRDSVGVTTRSIASLTLGGSQSGTYDSSTVVTIAAPNLAVGSGGRQALAHAVIASGAITGYVVDDPGYGYTSAPSVSVVDTGGGSGGTATAVLTAAPTMFRIERILEIPTRFVDSNNNTLGYGLTSDGQYCLVEVKCMKHFRGGTVLGVAA